MGVELPARGELLRIGEGRVVREGSRLAILSLGTRLADSLKAAELLEERGISVTVADARFAKPLDEALLTQLARHHEALLIVEEGAVGGFGSHVLQHLSGAGLLDGSLAVRSLVLPDLFLDHDKPEKMLAAAGLDAQGIQEAALALLGRLEARGGLLRAKGA